MPDESLPTNDPLPPDEPSAPRIFFSYAGEDWLWVKVFREYFTKTLSGVSIKDYRAESPAPYGRLDAALVEQIHGSAVVLAFVSEHYRTKKWTLREWEQSLAEAHRLIFVPIIMDAVAQVWWQDQRRTKEILTNLSTDYQYADFNDGGRPANADNFVVGQRIVDLALRLGKDLANLEEEQKAAKKKAEDEKIKAQKAEEGKAEEGKPETDVESQKPPNLTPDRLDVVVLGHPTAGYPLDLAEKVQNLVTALGAGAVAWGNGWRRKAAVRTEVATEADPVFVQPVIDTEAADYVQEKDKTDEYLKELGRSKPRVAIWLPAGYSDPEFEKAARDSASATRAARDATYPVLRTDTSDALAQWLRSEINPRSSGSTILQLEGYGSPEGSKPEVVLKTKQTLEQLNKAMLNIVGHVVEKPRTWPFWDTQLGAQMKVLPGSRAIVAVHDLNVLPNSDPELARRDVERKLDSIQKVVEAEQKQRHIDGKPYLKVFWTALLVNHAKAMPLVYPDDGNLKDWRLLGFSSSDENGIEITVPDPASLAVFRTDLIAWAAAG
jgi:hypothetical protein